MRRKGLVVLVCGYAEVGVGLEKTWILIGHEMSFPLHLSALVGVQGLREYWIDFAGPMISLWLCRNS
jgi:hypothetical protein